MYRDDSKSLVIDYGQCIAMMGAHVNRIKYLLTSLLPHPSIIDREKYEIPLKY